MSSWSLLTNVLGTTPTHTLSVRLNTDIIHQPQGNIWNEVTQDIWPQGQKVKRRESPLWPKRKSLPSFLIAINPIPITHQCTFVLVPSNMCSSRTSLPSNGVQGRTLLTTWQLWWVSFPWKLSKVCRWNGKNESEKRQSQEWSSKREETGYLRRYTQHVRRAD